MDKPKETNPPLRRGKAAKAAPVLPTWSEEELKQAMEQFQAKPKESDSKK